MSLRVTCTALFWGGMSLLALSPAQAQALGAGYRPGAASPARQGNSAQDPAEYYLTAYRLCQEAEEQARQGNYSTAVKKSNQAEKVLAVVVRDYPAWRPNMVAARRKLIANNLASYREKATQAPIPTGRQPGRALPKEVHFELPGIVAPPSDAVTGAGNEANLAGMAADDQELRATISRLQEECRRMAQAYKELYGRYSDTQKQLVAAQLDQKMYKERYEELQKRVASERAASNSVVESLSRQLAEMDEKYRASEKARREAEERVAALESELAQTQAELERVTRERDALKAENEQLRAIVELNTPEKTKALLDQNLSLAEQLKTAQQRIASLEGMMAGSDDQNDVLTQQLDEARAEAERLREEMSGIYDENRGYRRRISELTERLNNLEAELDASASQPVVDPALAEENKVLKEVIAKQRRTIEMQEKGRKLLVETYKQLKSANKEMLEELQKLDEESKLDLTDAERRLIESIRSGSSSLPDGDGADAVRRSLEIETLASLADKAFSKGRYTSAEQLYRTLYDYQPDHVPGLVNLGTILLYRNKCEAAVEYLSRATRLAPDLPITYFLAGISYYRLDKMDQAERMFTRTVELDPANAEAFFYLANIEGVSGRYELALKHFAAAVKLKPTLGDAHYNMARLYAEASRIPDAARAYDRAIHSGAEPDPEFENYLRNHPDNAQAPGADLVAEIQPAEEAARLRSEDPGAASLPSGNEEQQPTQAATEAVAAAGEEAAPQQGSASVPAPVEEETLPAHDETVETDIYTAGQREVLDGIARISKEMAPAPTPSPAGKGHETPAKRFGTVRVRTYAGGYRHRVKLRLKLPEPQRLRQRGGDIKELKATGKKKKR